MRRRKLAKIDPIEAEDHVTPLRRIKGAEVKRWCPDYDHKGPWSAVDGLAAPEIASKEALDALALTSRSVERCDWCGAERQVTGLELRRRMRQVDHDKAKDVREREARAELRVARFGIGSGVERPMLFLLDTADLQRMHMVGSYRSVCGSGLGSRMKMKWASWANGNGLLPNRCKECHAEILRVSNDQLDVLFAYMLAIGRLHERRHPFDRGTDRFDQETGRLLLSGEADTCAACCGAGSLLVREADFEYMPCALCDGLGWRLTEEGEK